MWWKLLKLVLMRRELWQRLKARMELIDPCTKSNFQFFYQWPPHSLPNDDDGDDWTIDDSTALEVYSFCSPFSNAVEFPCDNAHYLSQLCRPRPLLLPELCNCIYAINCTANISYLSGYIECQTNSHRERGAVFLRKRF